MKIYSEMSASDFEKESWCCQYFWDKIHEQHLEPELDEYFEECYPDGIEWVKLNDILRFDGDQILRDIGYVGLDEEE